jgi:hypothetical protein
MSEIIQIDCHACRTRASMVPTKIPRFSGIVRAIGFIIVTPSVLGIAFSGLMLILWLTIEARTPVAQSDAEVAGQMVGTFFVGGFIFLMAIASLVGGLVGWLLIMTRKVFKCRRCGFVMDRG